METLIDYGLVLLFFLGLLAFVITVLLSHPYEEPSADTAPAAHAAQKRSKKRQQKASMDTKIAYGVLSAILVSMLVLTVLSEREHS